VLDFMHGAPTDSCITLASRQFPTEETGIAFAGLDMSAFSLVFAPNTFHSAVYEGWPSMESLYTIMPNPFSRSSAHSLLISRKAF
jgi:hypothetical protein